MYASSSRKRSFPRQSPSSTNCKVAMAIMFSILIACTMVYSFMASDVIARSTPKVNYDEVLPGSTTVTFNSHLGEIELHMWVSDTNNHRSHSPAIFLPGAKAALLNEWAELAQKVSKSGLSSCLVNFHSNPKALHGSPNDHVRILSDIRNEIFHSENIFLFGKSLGGAQAMKYVQKNPSHVEKLVLVAPALQDETVINEIAGSKVPVFLAWAKDDAVIPYETSNVWKSYIADITLHTANSGGHAVLPEFYSEMMTFLLDGLPE